MQLRPSLAIAFLLLANPAFAKEPVKPASAPSAESTYELLNLFGDVFERVRADYVEPVSDEKLIESAINGMLTALDPHSGYMNEKSFGEMQVQTKGEFGGLGIEVTMENGIVKVVSPIDDTPAFKAGIKAGDYITEIDEEQVTGMTLSDAVDKMRGQAGTKVKLTIIREGFTEPKRTEITRDVIRVKSVKSEQETDVAYLRIVSFSETTYDTMAKELQTLKTKMGKNLKGIVLDLRNNPGGLLDQAVSVSDAFLDAGEIVSTRERDPINTKRYSATKGDLADGLPMVVIINNGSASASEIVAGALKDHKRAVVLGTKSFGKGSVQTVIPLKDHGAMRLTTARYYTPAGVSIQAKGIEPDIVVEQAKVERLKDDPFFGDRSEASLRGHLMNNDEVKEESKPTPSEPSTLQIYLDKNKTDEQKKAAELEKDYQLSRALDLIRALAIYGKITNGEPVDPTKLPAASAK